MAYIRTILLMMQVSMMCIRPSSDEIGVVASDEGKAKRKQTDILDLIRNLAFQMRLC